jgi:DNA modification methylase
MFKVYNGNCSDVMREILAKGEHVDCVITDPPFVGLGFKNRSVHDYWSAMNDYYRLMSHITNRISISTHHRFHIGMKNKMKADESFLIYNCFVESSRNGNAYFTCNNPLMNQEQFSQLENETWDDNIVSESTHPFPRNINKMSKIIKAMSKEGETVLDPFCGSAALGVACLLLNRNYIGIEIFEDRANDAIKRLQEAEAFINS